jgi:hypothetical protein
LLAFTRLVWSLSRDDLEEFQRDVVETKVVLID